VHDLPQVLVERLQHYFSTYKLVPGMEHQVTIDEVYDADFANKVVKAAMEDYDEFFGQ
jgi:inorganic pyrophosphatase